MKKKVRIKFSVLLVYTFLVLSFLILLSISYVWANGLKFDWKENKIEKTITIAIEGKLKDVDIYLNDQLVAQGAPRTFYRLQEGSYKVAIKKVGCYDWNEYFYLTNGQVAVIDQVVMVRTEPVVNEVARKNLTVLPLFDYGLEIVDGELRDNGNLITRFSGEVVQVHRFNKGYLYQRDSQLRLYFPKGPNDFLIYRLSDLGVAKLELLPNSWKIILNSGDKFYEIDLINPSESAGGNPRTAD